MVNLGLSKLTKVKSVSKVLIADEDHTVFSIAHPKHLPIFASPLAADQEKYDQKHRVQSRGESSSSIQKDTDDPSASQHIHEFQDPEAPVLHRAHESGVIQLFYDLFFVANLTTFTAVHEINNGYSLRSYVGFFFILWSTWMQVALFDVRFGSDSLFERLCKALQFGIMIGFAIVGPESAIQAALSDEQTTTLKLQALQYMSLILMASRLILAFQYGVVFYWLRGFKKARLVLLLSISAVLLTAMVFLGVSFIFTTPTAIVKAPIAWYPVIFVEGLFNFVLASRSDVMSLRKTCIVERLGLLTLIILGEGVIGICASINRVGLDHSFSSDVIGMIVCAVVIIYSVWMLYFDQIETEHVGTIRQQFWIIFHFVFHAAVLLTTQGVTQFSIWRKVVDLIVPFVRSMKGYPVELHGPELADYFNRTIEALYSSFSKSTAKPVELGPYFDIFNDPTSTFDSRLQAGYNITAAGVVFVCTNFGIPPPESSGIERDPFTLFIGIYNRYIVVYLYFFVSAGLVLLLLALLSFLGKRNKVRGDYVSIVVRVLIGLGLSLLALMALPTNVTGDIGNYIYSPWMLPTVAISYILVVAIDNIIISYVRTIVMRRTKEQRVFDEGDSTSMREMLKMDGGSRDRYHV